MAVIVYIFILYQQCTYFLPYQLCTIVNLIVGYRNMNTGHALWFHSSIRQSPYHVLIHKMQPII